MKNLTWQNPEQLFVAQELINKVKSKCCGIKGYLCWDKTAEKFVRFYPKKEIDLNEAFSLFKRFEVVMGTDVNDIDVNDDDCLDLL